MKQTFLKPFFWLTAVIGYCSLLTLTPQAVIGQTHSTVLFVQQTEETTPSNSVPPELEKAIQQIQEAADYLQVGQFAEAVALIEPALAVFQEFFGSEHPKTQATELLLKGARLAEAGQFEDAAVAFKQAQNITQELTAENNSSNSSTSQSSELEEAERFNQEVEELYAKGQYNQAVAIAERVLEMREEILGENHPTVATSLNNLAELYRFQERYSEAEPLDQRSLVIREKTLGTTHPDVGISLNNLGLLYFDQGRYSEAEPLDQRSLVIWEKALGTKHPRVATNLNNLAELYRVQGRYREAEPLYQLLNQ